MLILNDDINLENLEKYEFYKPKKEQNFLPYILYTNEKHRNHSHLNVFNDKEISLVHEAYDYENGLDTLFDMIKDGIVKKVSNENEKS